MRVLKYGYYGEDIAHRTFVEQYLKTFKSQYIDFEIDTVFCEKYFATNRKKVDNQFAEVAEKGFYYFQQDFFVVCRDIDAESKRAFDDRYAVFSKKIERKEYQSRIVFMLPVQCIEHWLWYLKWKVDNPNSTKNESIESQTRTTAKQKVYQNINSSKAEAKVKTVLDLMQTLDLDWLESRSESFRHFHNQVKAFLEKKK